MFDSLNQQLAKSNQIGKFSKFNLLLWLITTVTILISSLPVKGQTVLESVEETGILKVAVREDAAPFGFVNSANELQGYCLEFIALLEAKIQQQLQRDTILVQLLKSTVSNRFELVEQGLADLECGSNTIRELDSPQIAFSRPFFVTQTQFLTPTEKLDELDLEGNLDDITLGVIRNTTTEKLLREDYPNAKLVLFSGITARNRGVQAVTQGKITAMVSDGILLEAEAAKQQLAIDEYVLIPETISQNEDKEILAKRDRYGMIIKGNDPQWQKFVNNVIVSQESQQLFLQWFGQIESFPQDIEEIKETIEENI